MGATILMGDSKNKINSRNLPRIIGYTLTALIIVILLLYFMVDNKNKKNVPETFMITNENYFDYQSGLECSAFSSAYILRHFGKEADGVELFRNFPGKVPDGGVSPNGIETFFDERGYKAEFIINGTIEDLKEEVSKGVPVIVFIRVNQQEVYTHYVPLVGYDNEYFYFAESLPYMANCKEIVDVSYNRKTKISEFDELWNNIEGFWDYPYFVITEITSE